MTENKSLNNTRNILESVFKGIQEKKGHHILDLDLTRIENAVTNHFVICHGESSRQVTAIADAVEEAVRKETSEKPWHREGVQNAEWILLDYSNVVVHIFNETTRKFYNLEGLWADAQIKEIEA
ncbi:MAG: ribosome silencing factor [Clostridia bacterium]|nr:ribosome silencing factor [Clostridia bacterium]